MMSDRRSFEPRRVHPLAIIPQAVQVIKNLVIPFSVFFITQAKEHPTAAVLIGIGALLFVTLFGTLWWLNFTYAIQEGELRIRSGIVKKKQRFVPLERVQSVDLAAGVLFRMLGLVKLQVETASDGRTPEVSLLGIKRHVAEELQALIKTYKQGTIGQPPVAQTDEQDPRAEHPAGVPSGTHAPELASPSRTISTRDLLFMAVTSAQIGLMFPVIFTIQEYVDGFFRDVFRFFSAFTESAGFFQYSLLAMVLLAVAVLLSIISTLFSYANFTVTRTESEIKIQRGLLERRELTVPLKRLQGIRIEEGVLRQPFGYVAVHVMSGGYGKSPGQSTLLFPLLKRRDLESFLRDIVPEFTISKTLRPLPAVAKRRYMFRLFLWSGLFFVLPACLFIPNPYGYWSLAALPLALFWGALQHRDGGWGRQDGFLTLRMRYGGRMTAIIPERKIQSFHRSQSITQERLNLYTCGVRTMAVGQGRTYSLRDVDTDDLLGR